MPVQELDNSAKRYREGTHRTVPPGRTLAKVKPFLDEMGITRLANLTGLDRIGVPVVSAVRPNSRSVSISQGKGTSLDAAMASAAMEAIENYHAERIVLPLKFGSYNEFSAHHDLVDVDALPKLKSGAWHPDRRIFWIEGRELSTGTAVWLPFEMVHSNYTVPAITGSGCFVSCTNGLASGNHILEAIAHGICEVVERDANSLWNRLSDKARATTRIDLSTIADPECLVSLQALRRAGFAAGIWDMTSDVGIPAFYCLIVDEQVPLGHSGGGAGCHLDPAIAVSRAITEAIQVRTNYIAGARDDLGRSEYQADEITEKNNHARRLMDLFSPKPLDFARFVDRSGDSFESDVETMLDRLGKAGIEKVLCVDLTNDAFQIPVVRIVIPGLEGPDDHEDYLPGLRAGHA
ncbi:YcaO-like family protein [Roseibium aggregatum]|uniref:YcaO-like family protein n=1 Tax=Roseibium aggregatum TaxID=187304 RepID=A0A939J451_9HYPH|nr:YcaO-like family protein [Roseibium aggregatum]MBN9671262.1 YcaO-like family protein [Roseibium aggregatum]